jgi:hypothetical protein
MFPQDFETIPCDHLIGPGVKPEYLKEINWGESWINYL